MGHVIRNLLALQEIDLQIISLSDERADLLDSVNEKKSEAERQRRELEEQKQKVKSLKVELKQLEGELAGTSDRARKLEAQQVLVKTNQEYKALDKEIYEAKAHQAHIEDLMLQKMELLEQEKISARQASKELDTQGTQLERDTSIIEEKAREIEGRIAGLQADRSRAAAGIEDKALKLYERIFNSKKGPVLVAVVNRACQGCHLAVPAAVESVLRRGEADIITCENCSRILYIPEDESP